LQWMPQFAMNAARLLADVDARLLELCDEH
jgi:hypothetical protein